MSTLLWATAIGVSAIIALVAWLAARQGYVRWRDRRFALRSARVREALAQARTRQFAELDKVLFDMRDSTDPTVIESELREELRRTLTPPPALVRAFDALGITARYLAAVRASPSWQQRALAATMLGALGEARAVEPLLAAMRDPREDADVKLAAAEALGQIRDPAVIPLFVGQLEHVDEWSSPRLAAVLTSFGAAAVEPLVGALTGAPSINARVWAVQVLGKLGDRSVVPILLARLHDRSEALRMSVANALGELADARAQHPLVELVLRDPSATVRAQAAAALGRIGDAGSVPLLVSALGDVEHWVRLRALEAIEMLAPQDTAPLEAALTDANREVRHRAALALDRVGALEHAFTQLASEDEVRWTGARETLVAVGRAGLSERLTRHLDAPDARTRARVVDVLAALGEPAHSDSLVRRLTDADGGVRRAAIAALGGLGGLGAAAVATTRVRALLGVVERGAREESEAATRALLAHSPAELATTTAEILRLAVSERDDVRAGAVRLLAPLPGDDVLGPLRAALSDRFAEVRVHALRGLAARKVSSATDEIGAYLDDPSVQVQIAAADALGAIGGGRAIELLVKAMPRARAEFRDAVCSALAGFGWGAAYPAFDVLLASDEVGARIGAVWTLGKTGDARAVKILTMLLAEPVSEVRSAAAGALAKLGGPDAELGLVGALGDPSPFVRAAVVNALGALGTIAPEVLAERLADPDAFVRKRAAFAIGLLGGERADQTLAAGASALPPDVLAIARGVTGTGTGATAALGALRDAACRREVERALGEETAALRRRFAEHVEGAAESATTIDLTALVERRLATLSNSSDPSARRRAVTELGAVGDDAAMTGLARALRHDPDPEVRWLAAAHLTPSASPGVRGALLAAVRDPHPRVRIAAITAAAPSLAPAEAGPLFATLESVDPDVVRAAEAALAAIHDRNDAILAVVDWVMAQEAEPLVLAGLGVLRRLGDARALRAVQALAGAPSSAIRVAAFAALGALRVPDAFRAALRGLGDPVVDVRIAAIRAIGGSPRGEVLDGLAAAARDPDPAVRGAVVDACAAASAERARATLGELATDVDPAVAARAIGALCGGQDAAGLAAVIEVWPRLPGEVRLRVRTELRDVTALRGWLGEALDAATRERAVRVLALVDATQHAEAIAAALRDPDGRVRLAAVQALAPLDSAQIGERLAALRDDPVAEIRTAVRRAPWKVV